jgi:hypothetical protein
VAWSESVGVVSLIDKGAVVLDEFVDSRPETACSRRTRGRPVTNHIRLDPLRSLLLECSGGIGSSRGRQIVAELGAPCEVERFERSGWRKVAETLAGAQFSGA